MADTPQPNAAQRDAVCQMFSHAFVELRALAREERHKQIDDLADAFHNIPPETCGAGTWSFELTRGMLADYQAKYHESACSNYVAMLDAALDPRVS